MSRLCVLALFGGIFVLAGGLVGQEPKKDDPKKDEPAAKLKGRLPAGWGTIGLTDMQKQTIYGIQGKYGAEIDKLKEKILELETTRNKEMRAVLTPEQKKALEANKEKDKDK